MNDLTRLIFELSKKQMTRKQFLALASGSFLGMVGFFHILEIINSPETATGKGIPFGDKEYGRPGIDEVAKAKAKSFSEDVFG